jgi:hypothetical protein
MKVVLEDMYSTTVAVPGLTIEVYSRYKQGELLENLQAAFFRTEVAGKRAMTSSTGTETYVVVRNPCKYCC